MAFHCPWPCVADSVQPKVQPQSRSFAQALRGSNVVDTTQLSTIASQEIDVNSLPAPCIKGDLVCIKISQDGYARGLELCLKNLHGRVVLNKGDVPLTAHALQAKLMILGNWSMEITLFGSWFVRVSIC